MSDSLLCSLIVLMWVNGVFVGWYLRKIVVEHQECDCIENETRK